MATYKYVDPKTKTTTTTTSAAEAGSLQWHGHSVMDNGAGDISTRLDMSNSNDLKNSDAHSLMGPTHRGKTWSGA